MSHTNSIIDKLAFCRKLTEALKPSMLKVRNDSSKHAGHSGNPGGGADAETHFE